MCALRGCIFTSTVCSTAGTLATAPLLSTGGRGTWGGGLEGKKLKPLTPVSPSPQPYCGPHHLTPKTQMPGIRATINRPPQGRLRLDPRGYCFRCKCQTSCTDYQLGTRWKCIWELAGGGDTPLPTRGSEFWLLRGFDPKHMEMNTTGGRESRSRVCKGGEALPTGW